MWLFQVTLSSLQEMNVSVDYNLGTSCVLQQVFAKIKFLLSETQQCS